MLVAISALGLIGLAGIRDDNVKLEEVRKNIFMPLATLTDVRDKTVSWNRALLNLVLSNSLENLDKYKEHLSRYEGEVVDGLARVEKEASLTAEEKALIRTIHAAFDILVSLKTEVTSIANEGKKIEARNLIWLKIRPQIDIIETDFEQLIDIQQTQLGETLRAAQVAYRNKAYHIVMVGAVLLLGAIILQLIFKNKVIRDISDIVRSLRMVARGNLSGQSKNGRIRELSYVSQEINQMVGQLREANEFREQTIRTINHELRNPLTTMKLGLAMIIDKSLGDLNDRQSKTLLSIDHSVNRLIRTTEELLEVAKPKVEVNSLHLTRVELGRVIKSALQLHDPKAAAKGLKLVVNLPDGALYARADEDKIMRVLTNLIGNAVKYTDHGQIEVSATQEGEEVVVAVSDTGIGISGKDLPKLFKEFAQGENSARIEDQGTGLGLFISKNIVELHRGRIWAESKEGKGSRFSFILPIDRSENKHSLAGDKS